MWRAVLTVDCWVESSAAKTVAVRAGLMAGMTAEKKAEKKADSKESYSVELWAE